MSDFTADQKQAAFDLISNKFFKHNFGQTSKADFEVLMFKIYIEHKQANNGDISDFFIATELGITEAKVRNLKVKKELQYPSSNEDWIIVFIKSIQYAFYDEKNELVKLSITDPNVKRNIEHKVDTLHVYTEAQLNGKLLQMRPDHFIQLVQSLSLDLGNGAITKESLLDHIKKSTVEKELAGKGLTERIKSGESGQELIKDIIKAGGKAGVSLLLSSIPFGGMLEKYIESFIEKL